MFYVEEFIQHLKETRYRRHATLQDYRRLLDRFCRHCNQHGVIDIRNIGKTDALGFIESLQQGKRATQAVRIKIYRLQVYFRFLENNGLIFLSPLARYRIPKPQKRHYPVVSQEDMNGILAKTPTDGRLSLKGKAILELAYSSALRPQELYHLRISDINFHKGTLFIQQSKNKKDRLVPVGKNALYWTMRYIREVRPRYLHGMNHDYVFVSHKTGQPLTVYGIRWAIQETLRRCGLAPIKPYSLRRSAATHLLLNGMGVMHISTLLGHQSVTTTQYYPSSG